MMRIACLMEIHWCVCDSVRMRDTVPGMCALGYDKSVRILLHMKNDMAIGSFTSQQHTHTHTQFPKRSSNRMMNVSATLSRQWTLLLLFCCVLCAKTTNRDNSMAEEWVWRRSEMGNRVSDIKPHSVPLEKFIVMACRSYMAQWGAHWDC